MQEVDRLGRRVLADGEAVAAADAVERIARRAGHGREREPAEALAHGAGVARVRLDGAREPLAHELDGAVVGRLRGRGAAGTVPRSGQEAFLERLERDQLLEVLAGLHEARIGPVAGGDGLVHARLAAVADREVRPVEGTGPGVLAGEGDRGDALVLQGLDGGEELVPGRREGRDPGVLEGLGVVPEADEAEVERHAVVLAVDLVHAEGARVDRRPSRSAMSARDVLDQAGLDLLAEAAAAPGLEQVGDVALLQQRRQLGLERLVLVDLDVDRDVRVGRHVLVGQVLPQAEARVVVLDVIPGDGDRLGGLRRRRPARRRRRRRRLRSDGAVEAVLPEHAPNTSIAVAASAAIRPRDIDICRRSSTSLGSDGCGICRRAGLDRGPRRAAPDSPGPSGLGGRRTGTGDPRSIRSSGRAPPTASMPKVANA